MRAAYADPPYPGQAKRHYADDPRCAEVNHEILIGHLETYDGWALSTSSAALKKVLSVCPDDVRVGSWVKPFCSFKPNVNPAFAWEPVIFKQVRRRGRHERTVRDWISANITLKRGTHGAKPKTFWFWLFDLIAMNPEDEFYDLFPGSGLGMQVWEHWRQREHGIMSINQYQMTGM